MKKQIKLLAIIFLSSLILISCSDDEDSNPVDGNNNTVIKGRVTGNTGYGSGLQKANSGIEGATVMTAEIQSDGSIQTTTETSVKTDINGEFELKTNASGKSNLVLVATKGTSKWMAIISSEIKIKQTNYAPPLNSESTAEVEVYAEVVADKQNDMVAYKDVAFYVDSELAVKINADSNIKTKVKQAVVAEVEARNNTFSNSYYGYTNAEIETANSIETEAQKEFELSLYLNGDSETSYNMAWNAYYNKMISGYDNSSISISDFAEIKEIAGKVMIKMNSDLDSETKFLLKKRNAYLKAIIVANATLKEYEKAGADEEEMQAVDGENNNLLLQIKNSTSVNAINNAFVSYRNNIKANLSSSFSTFAAAFVTISGTIEATFKAALESAINASTNIQAVINAYTTFYSSISGEVSSELSINDNSKLEAFANIYALIYMHN